MLIRKANEDELDALYLMGFDTWGDELSHEAYLIDCRNSEKYSPGVWYVLTVDEKPVASLIVYENQFGLSKNCFGIGSVAVSPAMRGNGFGANLTQTVTNELLDEADTVAVLLHSDIDHSFYEKLGYQCIQGTNCMWISRHLVDFDGPVPSYF